MTIQRILVGFDGSENARRALDWASTLATDLDAELIVAHAVGLIPRDAHGRTSAVGSSREELEARFEETWSEPLRAAGVRYRFAAHDGSPVDVLLGLGDELAADVIVTGRRGSGGAADLLLGSTSSEVSRRAGVPVVIVPDVDG